MLKETERTAGAVASCAVVQSTHLHLVVCRDGLWLPDLLKETMSSILNREELSSDVYESQQLCCLLLGMEHICVYL